MHHECENCELNYKINLYNLAGARETLAVRLAADQGIPGYASHILISHYLNTRNTLLMSCLQGLVCPAEGELWREKTV